MAKTKLTIGKHKRCYVYILKCADGKYYTGMTNNMERRLQEHQDGVDPDCFTYSRRPVELVYSEYYSSAEQAIEWEKRIKKWSVKKKEALIDRNYEALKELAACKNWTHYMNYKNKRKQES